MKSRWTETLSFEWNSPSLPPRKRARAGHRSVSLHIFAARAAVDNYIGQKTIFLQPERSDTVFSLMSNSTNQFCVDTPAQRGAAGQSAHKSSPFIALRARACAHAIVRANVVEMRTQSRGVNPRSARIARNARNVWSSSPPPAPLVEVNICATARVTCRIESYIRDVWWSKTRVPGSGGTCSKSLL